MVARLTESCKYLVTMLTPVSFEGRLSNISQPEKMSDDEPVTRRQNSLRSQEPTALLFTKYCLTTLNYRGLSWSVPNLARL